MKLYYENNQVKLYEGNMLDMLESIEPNSIDAIICDPPYGLTNNKNSKKGFMNKSWDASKIETNVEAWRKCYEVLKPGAYLLAFGGTRTFHRIACAIEDAGFEIRDTLMWLYGSGFPKSHNVGLALDRKSGIESEVVGVVNKGSSPLPNTHIDKWCDNQKDGKYQIKQASNDFSGYGTTLKPAYEPIIMARKPLEGSTVDNMLKYGVGGINIDECRVGDEKISTHNAPKGTFAGGEPNRGSDTNSYSRHRGRFPSNVITDGSDEVKANMSYTKSTGQSKTRPNFKDSKDTNLSFGQNDKPLGRIANNTIYANDEGSVCRYFYCAKASKKDRDEGCDMFQEQKTTDGNIRANSETARQFGVNSALRRNDHPTVKPTKLMQYLIRLVLPRGGVLLDCFMGSGSTGKACMFENRERNADYKFIGVELTKEYLPIARARIDYAINKYEYDKEQEETKTGQLHLF